MSYPSLFLTLALVVCGLTYKLNIEPSMDDLRSEVATYKSQINNADSDLESVKNELETTRTELASVQGELEIVKTELVNRNAYDKMVSQEQEGQYNRRMAAYMEKQAEARRRQERQQEIRDLAERQAQAEAQAKEDAYNRYLQSLPPIVRQIYLKNNGSLLGINKIGGKVDGFYYDTVYEYRGRYFLVHGNSSTWLDKKVGNNFSRTDRTPLGFN